MSCTSKQLNIGRAFRLSRPRPHRYALHYTYLCEQTANPCRPVLTTVKSSIHHVRYSAYPLSVTQFPSSSHARAHRNYLQHPITDWREPSISTYDQVDAMAGPTSVASNTSSGKRKRSSPKFYAVKVGRTPGIYHSWEDCKAQTEGIKSQCMFPTCHVLYKSNICVSQKLPYSHRSRGIHERHERPIE